MQTVTGGGGWTWSSPLSDGDYANLPNQLAFNTWSYLAVRVATFNVVTVQTTGSWRSN